MAEIAKVRIADEYSPELAAGIGQLLPALSERHSGEPVPRELLEAIIDSPDRDQFVAEMAGRIVGTGTLNLIVGPMGKKAYLEDFVTSPDEQVRSKAVGYQIWEAMRQWCVAREVDLEFTSKPERAEAHRFYQRQGAHIKPTSVFRANFS